MISGLLFLMLLSPTASQEVMSTAGLTEDERKMLNEFKVGVTKEFGDGKQSIGESLDRLAD